MSNRILMIEDDHRIARALEARLGALGYQTRWAENASTGIALAEELNPDLLVVDIELPDHDGLLVCTRLRAVAQLSQTPIIIYSSKYDVATQKRAAQAGASAFAPKTPFTQAVVDMVMAFLPPPRVPISNGAAHDTQPAHHSAH